MTLKILFIDPARFAEEYLKKIEVQLGKLSIIVIYEEGAHPAYLLDTKISVEFKEVSGEIRK